MKKSTGKVFALLLVLTLSAGCLFGCGKGKDEDDKADKEVSDNAEAKDDNEAADEDDSDVEDDGDEQVSGEYAATVKTYMDAYRKCDTEKLLSAYAEEYVDAFVNEEYDGDRDKLIKSANDSFNAVADKLEKDGGKLSDMKYTVDKEEDMSETRVDYWNAKLASIGVNLEAEAGASVCLKTSVPIKGKDDREALLNMTLLKIDGTWYVIEPGLKF